MSPALQLIFREYMFCVPGCLSYRQTGRPSPLTRFAFDRRVHAPFLQSYYTITFSVRKAISLQFVLLANCNGSVLSRKNFRLRKQQLSFILYKNSSYFYFTTGETNDQV